MSNGMATMQGCCCATPITACSGASFIGTSYDLELEFSGGSYSTECDVACNLNGNYILTWDGGLGVFKYSATLPGTCPLGTPIGKHLNLRIEPVCTVVGTPGITLGSGYSAVDVGGSGAFLLVGDASSGGVCMLLRFSPSPFWTTTTPNLGEWSSVGTAVLQTVDHGLVDCACLDGTGLTVRGRFV